MLKKILVLFIVIACIFGNVSVAFAHQDQGKHDVDLRKVLFGEGYIPTGEKKEKFQAIANAASLCIDQYSSNATDHKKEVMFNKLKNTVGFSISFKNFDLEKKNIGVSVTPRNHRWYTHQGWNYPENAKKDKTWIKFWKIRKKVLTSTVNLELFNKAPSAFSKIPFVENYLDSEDACNKQCEAFCVLVYYVHILGDYDEANAPTPEFIQQLVPLYRANDVSNPGMIQDLIDILPDLFPNNENSRLQLQRKLEKIASKSKHIQHDNIQTQEEFEEYKEYALEVVSVLKECVPDMLRREDFFADAFYRG